ncbi:MAG: hypothetical protein Q7J65_04725, partial [Candidatus Marinimicrobia bacterium]|nr:hypothetical protein [Candidatus Neomarinimicrobiota bacterium]
MRLNRLNHRFFPEFRIPAILIFCSGLLFSHTNTGSSFYIKSEFISESNIFEDSTKTQSAGNQIWFGLLHNYLSKRQNLRLKLVSNLACYTRHPVESKAVSMLAIQYNY